MRISGDIKSENFWRLYYAVCPDVFLDGQKVHVVEADDVQGYVIREVWEGGRPKVIGNSIATIRTQGVVTIKGTKQPWA